MKKILIITAMTLAVSLPATLTWAGKDGGDRRGPPGDRRDRMKACDANEDQAVSWEEFLACHEDRLRRRFDHMDRNGDGVISADDRRRRDDEPGERGEGQRRNRDAE
tara:strand:- start:4507 stop:4827 length:321 start_codon:yes stop_codon:yes gene_type:complete